MERQHTFAAISAVAHIPSPSNFIVETIIFTFEPEYAWQSRADEPYEWFNVFCEGKIIAMIEK
jgi:hypothetical protein